VCRGDTLRAVTGRDVDGRSYAVAVARVGVLCPSAETAVCFTGPASSGDAPAAGRLRAARGGDATRRCSGASGAGDAGAGACGSVACAVTAPSVVLAGMATADGGELLLAAVCVVAHGADSVQDDCCSAVEQQSMNIGIVKRRAGANVACFQMRCC
jgi:hypothetical protein